MYELAQQLKEKGYPIETLIGGVPQLPTTNQLTDMLGTKLNYITRNEDCSFTAYTYGTAVPSQTGTTLDEALALLLIALKP